MASFKPGGTEFLTELRKRVGRLAVNSSSARNMGRSGLIESGQEFLGQTMELKRLKRGRPENYPALLNELTHELSKVLRPYERRGSAWGPARIFLNIFIRDAFYDFYLREAYSLGRLEAELEIPLDSYVGRRLREVEKHLPRWSRVIDLTPEASAQFQDSASKVAKRLGTYRVHLDVIYWQKPASQNGNGMSGA
jgi:hypothetical protein